MDKKTWKDFQESGLLWWINQILHTFGWAIALEADEYGNIVDAYPARTKFRGFPCDTNDEGYKKVSKFMKDNAHQLFDEAQ